METEKPARTTTRWIELDVAATDGVMISIRCSEIVYFRSFIGGPAGAIVCLKNGQRIEVRESYNRIKVLLMGDD